MSYVCNSCRDTGRVYTPGRLYEPGMGSYCPDCTGPTQTVAERDAKIAAEGRAKDDALYGPSAPADRPMEEVE